MTEGGPTIDTRVGSKHSITWALSLCGHKKGATSRIVINRG